MQYVTSIERRAIETGRQEGREEARREAKQEAKQEARTQITKAIPLIRQQMAADEIVEITGLDLTSIAALRAALEDN